MWIHRLCCADPLPYRLKTREGEWWYHAAVVIEGMCFGYPSGHSRGVAAGKKGVSCGNVGQYSAAGGQKRMRRAKEFTEGSVQAFALVEESERAERERVSGGFHWVIVSDTVSHCLIESILITEKAAQARVQAL